MDLDFLFIDELASSFTNVNIPSSLEVNTLSIAVILSIFWGAIGFKTPPLWRLIERIGAVFYKRLNRHDRSDKTKKTRGILVLILFSCASIFIMRSLLTQIETTTYLPLFNGIILGSFISTSGVWLSSYRLGKTPQKQKIQPLTQDDLDKADHFTLRKALITYQARSIDRFLLAPLIAYYIGGIVFLSFIMTISALVFSTNFKTKHSYLFSKWMKKIDSIIMFIPSRLGGFLIFFISLFIPFMDTRDTKTTLTQAKNFNGLNGGWILAGFAGALNIALAGPATQQGQSSNQPWIGPSNSSAKIEYSDLIKGLFIHLYLTLLILAFCFFIN